MMVKQNGGVAAVSDRSEAPVDPSDRMDPLDRIDEIINIVEQARSVPMSRTNCMVERGEMIGMLEDLRAELPTDLRKAAACWRSETG